jgi:hypothetical protein
VWVPSPAAHQPPPEPPPSPAAAQSAPIRLKEPPKKPAARTPAPVSDSYIPPPTQSSRNHGRAFPWKAAAAAVVVVAVAAIAGRAYLPGAAGEAVRAALEDPRPPATAPPAAAALPPVAGQTGRLEIETQPAGARVLLDGKPAGESPLTIDNVPVGRHTLTFVSASGSVRRTVRVEAGRASKLDVPIFSGWVGIYAPFVVQVAEAGRVIGTTEDPRLMLSPGRHVLTLTNSELGYSSVQTVEIEPGEVRSLTLDPRGSVNLNASPWAEVWIDGKKVGDTPIANQPMPLGIREVIFRHPQFGERRVAVTVTANAPAAVSVDMTKP